MELSIFPGSMKPSKVSTEGLTLETIASKLTYFQEQIHLLHWQTNMYSEHKALGVLYEYIQDFKDELIEKLMGYTGKKPAIYKLEPLSTSTSNVVIDELLSFAKLLKEYGEMNCYQDVCNLSDSLSGEAAKVKYLLTLT
jgi:DNA-binding ferritin-like protein